MYVCLSVLKEKKKKNFEQWTVVKCKTERGKIKINFISFIFTPLSDYGSEREYFKQQQ